MLALTACGNSSGLLDGNGNGSLDSYFVTSTGKTAGYAKALAEICPRLNFRQAELDLHRVAICRGSHLADDCAVPNLEAATQQAFEAAMASLSGVAPAQVCAKASAEVEADSVLAAYLN